MKQTEDVAKESAKRQCWHKRLKWSEGKVVCEDCQETFVASDIDLRAALEEIAELKQSEDRAAVEEMKSIARNALTNEQEP